MRTRQDSRLWYSVGLVWDIVVGLGLLLVILYWHGVGVVLGCWLMTGASWRSPGWAILQFAIFFGLFMQMLAGCWPFRWVDRVMQWGEDRWRDRARHR